MSSREAQILYYWMAVITQRIVSGTPIGQAAMTILQGQNLQLWATIPPHYNPTEMTYQPTDTNTLIWNGFVSYVQDMWGNI